LSVLVFWWTLQKPLRWVALLLGAVLLLPPLPFALGDSGPHPALIVAAVGILIGLSRLTAWRLRTDLAAVSILLFFTALMVSLAPAALYSGGTLAAQSLARVMLFGIAVYVFFFVSSFGAAESHWVVRVVYLSGIIAAAFACVDFYFQLPAPAGFGPQFVWLDSGVFRRAQGLFYEASTLGNFCTFLLLMTAASMLRPDEAPVPRPVLALGAMLFGAALIFSYSRASVLGAVIGGAVLLVLNRHRFRLGRLLALAICALGGIFVVAVVWPEFAWSWRMRLEFTGAQFFTATETVLSGRLESWRILFDFLQEHPWRSVIGLGYKTLPYAGVDGRPVVADNMYLSILVETGWLGLVALLLLNFAILRSAWRARDSLLGACMLSFWCGEIVQMLSGDLLTYWRVLPVYFFVLAAMPRR
jgi:O-antigen ligase